MGLRSRLREVRAPEQGTAALTANMQLLKGVRARSPRKLVANGRRLWLYLQRKTYFGNKYRSGSVSTSHCPPLAPSLPSTPRFASFDGIQAAAEIDLELSRSCTSETLLSSSRSCSSAGERSILPSQPTRLPEAYDLVRTLNGKLGHFLTPIHLVRQRRSGKLFIVKQVELTIISKDHADDDDEEKWPIEASLLADLAHRNIIPLQSVHIDRGREGKDKPPICNIVLPYCNGGDLQDFLDSLTAVGSKVPEPFVLHFASSIIDALSYLHAGVTYDAKTDQLHQDPSQPSIIHRDIKPKNIFLDRNQPAENGLPTILLADFGLATTAEKNRLVCGTAAFFAPEVSADLELYQEHYFTMHPAIRDRLVNESIMSAANDWWAFGCCLFQLMTGKPYTYTPGCDAVAQGGISTELDLLLYGCLQPGPSLRPRATDLSLHQLSAKFKAQLQDWYDGGGRLDEQIWPEPFRFERAGTETEKETESRLSSQCTCLTCEGSQAAAGTQSSSWL